MRGAFEDWLRRFKRPTKVNLTTLLLFAFLAGSFGEVGKFGAKMLEGQCAANESAIAGMEIQTGLRVIELRIVELKNARLAERISDLSKKDPEVIELTKQLDRTRESIKSENLSLSNIREIDLPKMSNKVNKICFKARIIDGFASFMSGIFALLLTLYLFYFGILVSDLSSVRRNESKIDGIADEVVDD